MADNHDIIEQMSQTDQDLLITGWSHS